MTLVESGLLRFGQVSDVDNRSLVAEFGGTAPHSLSEYYRGAGLVPDTPTNAGVPTAGAISFSDFYGASALQTEVFTVTEGSFAGGGGQVVIGFSTLLGIGAINPTTLNTVPVRDATYATVVSPNFTFSLLGDIATGFFQSVQPQDGNLLLATAATRSVAAGITTWVWAGEIAPARWNGSGTSTVTVVF